MRKLKAALRKVLVFENLGATLPIYTTRPHGADKATASYSMTLWQSLLAIVLVWTNVVLWSIVGIVEAVGHLL